MGDHVKPGTTMFHNPSKITTQLLDDIIGSVVNPFWLDILATRQQYRDAVRKVLEEHGI